MIKDLKELKEFIIWAKKNKVKNVELPEVKFELSELSFIDSMNSIDANPSDEPEVDLQTLTDEAKFEIEQLTEEQKTEDEEALYWSSQG